MTVLSTTLRPGLLVSMSTGVVGNVGYDKEEIEGERLTDDGELVSKWETTKTVVDPAEYELAIKTRTKARGLITSICSATSFGYLCPESRAPQLFEAAENARRICDEFNKNASVTTIKFYVLTGRVNPDDAGAIRAINGELSTIISDMSESIKALDVEAVRKAAIRAKQLGTMLAPAAQSKLQEAIKAARDIAKQLKEAGDQAAVVVNEEALAALAVARTAFLDLDAPAEFVAPEDTTARAVDFHPAVVADQDEARDIALDFAD